MKTCLNPQVPIGSIYETPNGNVFFKVDAIHSAFIGNKDPKRRDESRFVNDLAYKTTTVTILGAIPWEG